MKIGDGDVNANIGRLMVYRSVDDDDEFVGFCGYGFLSVTFNNRHIDISLIHKRNFYLNVNILILQ